MSAEPAPPVRLDGRSLRLTEVAAIARSGRPVALAPAARERVPPMVEDREVGPDIEAVEAVLRELPEDLLG